MTLTIRFWFIFFLMIFYDDLVHYYTVMVIYFTNINKANNDFSSQLNSQNTKKSHHMTLEIQVQAWDMHKNVSRLNWLRGSQHPHFDNWVSNAYTYINKRYNISNDGSDHRISFIMLNIMHIIYNFCVRNDKHIVHKMQAYYHYNNTAHPVVCTVPLQQRCSPSCMHGTITTTLLTQLYARLISITKTLLTQLYGRLITITTTLLTQLYARLITITTTLLTHLHARYHYNNAAHPVVCTGW